MGARMIKIRAPEKAARSHLPGQTSMPLMAAEKFRLALENFHTPYGDVAQLLDNGAYRGDGVGLK